MIDQIRTDLAFTLPSLPTLHVQLRTLPFVRSACDSPPSIAIETRGRRGTASHVSLVGDIRNVESKPPVLHFVVDRRVADDILGNHQRVGGVGVRDAIISNAGAKPEAGQRPR